MLSVRDHLNAMALSDDWIIELGEAIQDFTQCDSAVAASRAKDLVRNKQLADGIHDVAVGLMKIRRADLNTLTPLQRRTVRELLNGIVAEIETLFT